MAENTNQNNLPKPEKIWYDQEEYAIRKKLPPTLPRRPTDIYISNKTAFKAQLGKFEIDRIKCPPFIHSQCGKNYWQMKILLRGNNIAMHCTNLV